MSSDKLRGKRESSDLNITSNLKACLVGILHSNSSPENPLDIKQINDKLNTLSQDGSKTNITYKTMRKHLDDLWCFSSTSAYSGIFKWAYGGSIVKCYLAPSSTRTKRRFIEASQYDDPHAEAETSANIKAFYYFQPLLSAQELFMLLGSIQTNPYFSLDNISTLQRKLINMTTPELFKQACSSGRDFPALLVDKDSARLLGNIAKLLEYIHSEIQIEVNHGRYSIANSPSFQDKYPLAPTRVAANGQVKWQRLDPVAIFQANGFYYLAAHNDKSKGSDDIVSYRIDRIIDIRPFLDPLSKKPVPLDDTILQVRKNFSGLEYQKSHPVMYAGEKSDIQMLVREDPHFNPVNAILDTFGRDVTIRPVSDSDVITALGHSAKELSDMGEQWYAVHLHHSISGTTLWAKQHINNVLITHPQEAVDLLMADVKLGLSRYERL